MKNYWTYKETVMKTERMKLFCQGFSVVVLYFKQQAKSFQRKGEPLAKFASQLTYMYFF